MVGMRSIISPQLWRRGYLVTNLRRVQAPWAGRCRGPGWWPPRPHLLLSRGARLLSRARDDTAPPITHLHCVRLEMHVYIVYGHIYHMHGHTSYESLLKTSHGTKEILLKTTPLR